MSTLVGILILLILAGMMIYGEYSSLKATRTWIRHELKHRHCCSRPYKNPPNI